MRGNRNPPPVIMTELPMATRLTNEYKSVTTQS